MLNELRYRFIRWMQGRYGTDALNRFLSGLLLVLVIAGLFIRGRAGAVLSVVIWILILLIYLRMFSKNISARYRENQKFLAMTAGVRPSFAKAVSAIRGLFKPGKGSGSRFAWRTAASASYKIFTCPSCQQKIRIPKGKGKIMVRCPKCGCEFKKRT